MKTTILYDNTVYREGLGLRSDWGFAALVESRGRKVLFDTGANGGILLSNMERLSVDPGSVSDVFISHAHFDHTGGLAAFLSRNPRVKIWTPPSFRFAGVLPGSLKSAGDGAFPEAVTVRGPRKLREGFFSTGELENIEQSLCVESGRGIVVVAGCSHPKMEMILSAAALFGKVYGIIGGLHGNPPESLGNLQLVCATHCTRYKPQIQALYHHRYVEGGVGRIIEVDDPSEGRRR
jgi:7,8-dihydropterin-6-yl-methyl-4-(beta-D-ribofuranosyl)aminobenzene 5'-phosphate synthase